MGDRGYHSSDMGVVGSARSNGSKKEGSVPSGRAPKGAFIWILGAEVLVGGRVASLSSTIERRVLGDGLATNMTMMAIAAVSFVRICAGDR